LGLGHWTWSQFRGKNLQHTWVVTWYCPVKNEKGPLLVYNQHRQYFLSQAVDICPLQQYIHDLKSMIEQWQQYGDLLIIGGNWNEEVMSPQWCAFGMN